MDKKGQLDKILGSLPTLIGVFIIMTIFILFAYGLRGFQSSTPAVGIGSSFLSSSVLLQEVSVSGMKMPLLHAVLHMHDVSSAKPRQEQEISNAYFSLISEMKQIVEASAPASEHMCLYLIPSFPLIIDQAQRNQLFVAGTKGKLENPIRGSQQGDIALYFSPLTCKSILSTGHAEEVHFIRAGQRISFISYYGRCESGGAEMKRCITEHG